ncbi:MAG TPA: hypothetical protein VGT03_04350 [Candidatus Acidoferrales bacterium]|nr:hypothetical protein [Candidatus Acidoferrales bacterium]
MKMGVVLKPTIPTNLALLEGKTGSFLVVQVFGEKCVEIDFCGAWNFLARENMHGYRGFSATAERSAKNA